MPAPAPAEQAKQRAALLSIGATAGLVAFKLAVALHTHSLGILAEAAHSGLDLLATWLTWISLRIAARPADANHPFGHGKFENFSAFLEAGLLVVTAGIVGWNALSGWIHGTAQPLHLDFWAFGVMAVAIAVDWNRVRMLRRTSETYASDALAADAVSFSADIVTSLAVIVGLALVALGRAVQVSWLRHADAAAALFVAGVMLWMAVELGRRTAGILLDEADPTLAPALRASVSAIEGVASVERLRLRRVGSRYFVDLQLELESASTLERAGIIRQEAASRIRERLPEADVVTETQLRPAPLGPFAQLQAVALSHNRKLHDLSIYDTGAGLDVEFHLEVPESQPLAQAHQLASRLENEMRLALPAIRQIVTHIEPESAEVSAANLLEPEAVALQVKTIAARFPELLDCHDIQLRQTGIHLALSCHCSFPDSLPVSRVHELVTRLEAEIKRSLPQLDRITIHPEPVSDNRR